MDLIRDLLDAQLVDRKGRNVGRVDGIVLELRANRAPRVAAMELGAVTLARRLPGPLARWAQALIARISPVSTDPIRIPLTAFRDIGVDIELDVDASRDAELLRGERWLASHIVERIPGGGA
jgi:sporulation protein YlmC with PRC-barrel domain